MRSAIEWLLGVKAGEFAGADSWRVGFVAEWGNVTGLVLLAVFVALVWLAVRSYRREGDARGRVKAVLAGVRIAVIVLVFVILFQPAVVLRYVKTLHRSLVLLVDDSISMSFADSYPSGQQRDRLAGLLAVKPDDLGGLTRMEIARKAFVRPAGPVNRLAADHPLMILHYSTNRPGRDAYTRLIDTIGPVEPGASDGAGPAADRLAELLGPLTGSGYETNIAVALRDALERTQGRRVAGIVLVSDGRSTVRGGSGLTGALEYARQRGVPLYAVAVGDPTPPRRLAVTGLQAPREVRRLASVEFTAMLSHRNMAGQTVRVRLMRRRGDRKEWTDTGVVKTVKLAAPDAGGAGSDTGTDRGIQPVALHHEPDELGRFVYKAVIVAGPDAPGTGPGAAAAPTQNPDEAIVEVSDEKINILLVSGDAGYEFQYIKHILYRAGDRYRLSVWQQNADKDISQVASTGMKLSRLPRELPELIGSPGGRGHPGYDVVILYDPQPTSGGFDEQFVDMLKTFVSSHGGGLCYVAGNKYSESVLPAEGPYKALMDLLPVVLAPNRIDLAERIGQRVPEPWPVHLTSYGLDHPVMRLGDSSDHTAQVWQVLPGIFWSHPVQKTKPAARALAVHSNPMRRTMRNKAEPLVVVQPLGAGRVLYVGSDETWRWRFVRDAYYHRRFWTNAVRFLASLKARKVVITTGGDRFAAGEKITIEVEAYDDQYRPVRDETFELKMTDLATDESKELTLKAVDPKNRPGQYRATFVARHTGTYELKARGSDGGDAQQGKQIIIELPQAEARRSEADLAAMRTVASHPDNFLHVHQVDKLAELIPPGRLTTYHDVPRELWDSPLALFLIVVLLVVEWILRKKHNMA